MSEANEQLEAVLQAPAGLETEALGGVSVHVVKHKQTTRQTEPTMKTTKTTLCLASLALAILGAAANRLSAAEEPPLNENLKPLAGLIGRWDVQWTGENGAPLKGRYTVRVGALGAILTGTFEMEADNVPVFAAFHVWSWQPETQSLACATFNSFGAHGNEVLTRRTDQTFVWQASGYTPDGKTSSHAMHAEFNNDDSFVIYNTQVVVAGEAKPDGPRLTFKRVKE